MMRMRGLTCCLATMLALVLFCVAQARDASVVSKLPGEGSIFHASSDGAWVAGWVSQPDGTYKLLAISTAKGDKQEVDSVKLPGGFSWVPNSTQLLYSKAVYNKATKVNMVECMVWDTKAKTRKRVLETNDLLETYLIDPIASDDGSRVFQMTMDPSLHFPSFNVYFKAENKMKSIVQAARIGSIYDLSADGNMLYWWMSDPKTKQLNLVLWDMNTLNYSDIFEFSRKVDPADDWALMKVDSPNKQAAISAFSEKDSTLQAVIYYYGDPKNLYTKAIRLGNGEQLTYLDWKGRTGQIYAVVHYTATKEFGIEEIDPPTGARTAIYRGKEPIESADYVVTTQTYYFSVVDGSGTSKAQTRIVRVK